MLRATDTSGLIYHYTSAAIAIEFILYDMQIRMGPLSDTNDPAEDGLPSPVLGERREDGKERADLFFDLETTMAGRKLACFSRDSRAPYSAYDPLSARGYGRDRMWAQYADNHKGVCLFFDRERLETNFRSQMDGNGIALAGPVTYERDVPLAPLDFDQGNLEQQCVEIVQKRSFTKLQDWTSEQEYRFLLVAAASTSPLYEYVSICGALVAICLGHRFPRALFPCIRDVCDRERIPALRLNYYGSPQVGRFYPPDDTLPLRIPPAQ